MPQFKNQLDSLLADAVLASGVDRQVKLNAIRDYLKKTSIYDLKKQVSVITSKPELSMLQASGVPQGLQEVFLYTYTRLTG